MAYQFNVRTGIHVGEHESSKIGELVKDKSQTKQAVVISDSFLVQSGMTHPIQRSLEENGFSVHIYDQVQSNPTMKEIDDVASLIRQTRSDLVVGMGGGSPLDVAKTAALVASGDQSVSYYALGAHPFPEKAVTVVAIPTTAGTGAEVTSTVVFSDEKHRKLWGWDTKMAPEFAILDPMLTINLPPLLTAATGFDAIVHAIEAATGKRTNPFIQGIANQAVKLVSKHLPIVLKQPENVQARAQVLTGACLAGVAIEHGGTGLAHNMGHALSTVLDMHHGQAVAMAFYHCYAFNLTSDQTEQFADLARALGVTGEFTTLEELALEGGKRIQNMIETSPLSLRIVEEDLEAIYAKLLRSAQAPENQPMRENNCVVPTDMQLAELIHSLIYF